MPNPARTNLLQVYGTIDKSPSAKLLKAGGLTALLSGGNLTDIRLNGLEVLRGVSYLVRDQNWGTCLATVGKPRIENTRGRCEVRFAATAQNGESILSYKVHIVLSPHELTFDVSATPNRDFQTNRTGFVVLHPIDGIAGKPVTVTHTDKTVTKSRFPKLISPGQPFFNIRSLEHKPALGLTARVLMEGHKFEMEDQRNWSDASFKTYVCSLLDPWPYVLKGGESISQRITLTVSGSAQSKITADEKTTVANLRVNARLPKLGLTMTAEDIDETRRHIDALKRLAPQFLLGHCVVGKTQLKTLRGYAAVSRESSIPFRAEIVLSATRDAMAEMEHMARAFKQARLTPESIVVTQAHDLKSFQPTDERPWGPGYEDMVRAARSNFPGVSVGGGMISYFTELNRKPPPTGVFDFITHSICPIVHDASDGAVMQTLETLPHIFASGRALMGEAPYHLGPTTIAARMNPYGKDVTPNPRWSRVCLAPNDPRHFGRFAGTWTLGLLAEASRAKLDSVCLGSLTGPRGLLQDDASLSPLAELLMELVPFGGKRVHAGMRSGVATLATSKQVFVGNTTPETVHLVIGRRKHRLAPHDYRAIANFRPS